jgi:excisionase family DNA binding protein
MPTVGTESGSPSPLEHLLLRQEAAEQLRVSLRKIDQMIARKLLTVVRLGRKVRIASSI